MSKTESKYLKQYFNKYSVIFFIVLLIILSIRVLFLKLNIINLYYDEAQYWDWSRNLDYGYYSKPPMIALLIKLTTIFGSDTEFSIRLGSPIMHSLTAILVFLLAKSMYDFKTAFWSGLTYLFLPGITVSSAVISTDVVLNFFWAAALYSFYKATKTNYLYWWVIAGISAGFGMLSKYNMIIFLLSVMLFLLLYHKQKDFFKVSKKRLILSILGALLVFTPNIIWNFKNSFVNFSHTVDNASLSRASLINIIPFIEFIAAQFAVFGPILMTFFIILLFKIKSFYKNHNENKVFLWSFSICFISVIMLFALLSRAHANWAAPTYVAATIMVVNHLINNNIKYLYWSTALHIIIFITFMGWGLYLSESDIERTKYNDPFNRMMGWSKFANNVGMIFNSYDAQAILTDDRKVIAELVYYLRGHDIKIFKWNYNNTIQDYYDMKYSANTKLLSDYILFSKKEYKEVVELMKNDFSKVEYLINFRTQLYNSYGRIYNVYRVKR